MERNRPQVDDPLIQKLIDSLGEMPEYLRERSRRIEERSKFVKAVWEKACFEAFGKKGLAK